VNVPKANGIIKLFPYVGLLIAVFGVFISAIVTWRTLDDRMSVVEKLIETHINGFDHFTWFVGGETLHPGLSRAIDKTSDRIIHEHMNELIMPEIRRLEQDTRDRWQRFFQANEGKGLIKTSP